MATIFLSALATCGVTTAAMAQDFATVGILKSKQQFDQLSNQDLLLLESESERFNLLNDIFRAAEELTDRVNTRRDELAGGDVTEYVTVLHDAGLKMASAIDLAGGPGAAQRMISDLDVMVLGGDLEIESLIASADLFEKYGNSREAIGRLEGIVDHGEYLSLALPEVQQRHLEQLLRLARLYNAGGLVTEALVAYDSFFASGLSLRLITTADHLSDWELFKAMATRYDYTIADLSLRDAAITDLNLAIQGSTTLWPGGDPMTVEQRQALLGAHKARMALIYQANLDAGSATTGSK